MAFNIPVTPRKYELPPKGLHMARCYLIADLGTQPSKNYEAGRKIMVGWEMIGKRWKDAKGPQGPVTITQEYFVSFGPKAALRKMLEQWVGRNLTSAELKGQFDFEELIGLAANIHVVHNEGAERTYANVASVMPEQEGQIIGDLLSPSILFSLARPDLSAFGRLPEWVQKKIQKAPEWAQAAGSGPAPQPKGPDREPGADADDEACPF